MAGQNILGFNLVHDGSHQNMFQEFKADANEGNGVVVGGLVVLTGAIVASFQLEGT